MTTPTLTTNPTIQHFLSLKLKDQRAYLCDLRRSDPATALRIVQSAWDIADAKARNTYLQPLGIGISLDDEPFLESVLDDRAKHVRLLAAALLNTLEGSRLVQRFTDQAVNCVDYMIHKRTNTPDKLYITLPTAYTPAMKRDGIFEKPYNTTSNLPAYWLFQMLKHIPPSTWTKRWNKTVKQIVEASFNTPDYVDNLIIAWVDATITYKNAEWAEALMVHDLEDIYPVTPHYLIEIVHPDRREQIIENALSQYPNTLQTRAVPVHMLRSIDAPWSAHFSKFVLDRLLHYTDPNTPEDTFVLRNLPVIARSLAPSIIEEAETLLRSHSAANPYYAAGIAEMVQILQSRRQTPEAATH